MDINEGLSLHCSLHFSEIAQEARSFSGRAFLFVEIGIRETPQGIVMEQQGK